MGQKSSIIIPQVTLFDTGFGGFLYAVRQVGAIVSFFSGELLTFLIAMKEGRAECHTTRTSIVVLLWDHDYFVFSLIPLFIFIFFKNYHGYLVCLF